MVYKGPKKILTTRLNSETSINAYIFLMKVKILNRSRFILKGHIENDYGKNMIIFELIKVVRVSENWIFYNFKKKC